MTLEALKSEISRLTREEREALAEWIEAQETTAWDEQIAADYRAGKLDKLIQRAEREHDEGTIREAP